MRQPRSGHLIVALCLTLLSLPGHVIGEEKTTSEMPRVQNKMIKITDRGLVPAALEMSVHDSIVFFYNDTSESLATLEVDFADKKTHCSSSKMVLQEAGKIRSSEPFGPKEFTTTCFHDPGDYPFTVYGVPGHPKGVTSRILVK